MFHLIWVVLAVLSGFLCHYLARFKRRSPGFWSVMGTVFGPFAVFVLPAIKPNPKA